MIIDMKKAVIVSLEQDKLNALEKLRDLGIMHIETSSENPNSDSYMRIQEEVVKIKKVLQELKNRVRNEENSKFSTVPELDICGLTIETLDDMNVLSKQLTALLKDKKLIEPWGNFSNETIAQVAKKGVFVYLCSGKQADIDNLPNDVTSKIISSDGVTIYFAIISTQELADLPEVKIPNASLIKINSDIASLESRLNNLNKKLNQLAKEYDRVAKYAEINEEKLEFSFHYEKMNTAETLSYISGFVPVTAVEELNKTAKECGWAVMLQEPNEDEIVPTLIKVPKIFEISKPIFDFIGISPGYREWDISIIFLIFFTIFFSMIVGDAGYGCLFLIIGIFLKFKFSSNKEATLPINLFLVLSGATIAWGFASGNYFAIPQDNLTGVLKGGRKFLETLLPWVNNVEQYKDIPKGDLVNKNVQYLCFLIAAIHLSFARIWKAVLYINKIPSALGQLGWAFLIWGNFFLAVELIVFKESLPSFIIYLYIPGFLLTTLFAINWKNIGDILNFPFGLIGSFVDVLSYIRLFAVGLSSFYIAKSFNDMGLMLLPKEGFSAVIIATIVIILFGHLLNIVLAFMGVLVHGIRLNTLEFSNHMELEWKGIVFKPFKKFLN